MRWFWNRFHTPAGIILFCLLWEIIRTVFGVSPLIMPPLYTIVRELFNGLFKGTLLEQLGLSMALIISGLFFSIIIAFLLTIAGSLHHSLLAFIELLCSVFHPLPGVALLPLIILWAGTGIPAVLVIILHSVIWPLAANISAGLKSYPAEWRMFSDNLGIGKAARFARVSLPAAFPFFLSGLRIGWSRAWRALISAEMIFGAVGGQGGLGWYLFKERVFMNTPGLYAGILLVMLVGVLFEKAGFGYLEKITVKRWGMYGGQ